MTKLEETLKKVQVQSQLEIGTVIYALGRAMSQLSTEEQNEYLRQLCDHLWDTSAEKKAAFIARIHKVAKDASDTRENLSIGYGGNVAYRYKKDQGLN